MQSFRVSVPLTTCVLFFQLGFFSPVLAAVSVPATACAGTEQIGPGDAETALPTVAIPKNGRVLTDIPQSAAPELEAYLYNRGFVLAPRGWQCAYSIDIGEYEILLTPKASSYGSYAIFERSLGVGYSHTHWITDVWANTYFPKIASEYSGPDSGTVTSEVLGTYRTDRLNYESDVLLNYETPARRLGVGSSIIEDAIMEENPTPKNFPISGFVSLSISPDWGTCRVLLFAIALPPKFTKLQTYIVRQAKANPLPTAALQCS